VTTTVTPEEAIELVRQGESQKVEFKQSFAEKKRAVESLCAFTNADGGTVFFGVSPRGKVSGTSVGDNTLENFSNYMTANTEPRLCPTIERLAAEGREIVAVTLPKHPAGELFHAFGRALIRVGPANQVMSSAAQRARLMETQEDRPQERDRPRLAVAPSLAGLALPETQPITPDEAPTAQALAGPKSKSVDPLALGRHIAKAKDQTTLRGMVRATRAFFAEEWPRRIEKLNLEAPASAQIATDQIYEHCLPYVQRFSPDAERVEQFGLALVDAEYEAGLTEIFRLLEDWISLSQRYWPGGSLRAVRGAPALLALRALANWGAKAADDMLLDVLRLLLTQPLATTESSGQTATLPLVDRRDLFWPAGLFDRADLAVQYLQTESWTNDGLQKMFASQQDYLNGLSRFLFSAALIHDARDETLPLYPGFKLIRGSSATITAFVKKLSADSGLIEALARAAGEDTTTFRARWPERVRRLNDAKLGGRYDLFLDWGRVPEQI
jgi:hypothetical protein